MPAYLLHGLWLPQSGFNLWVEQVEGHRIVTIDKVPDGTFPPAVHSLLAGASFRQRAPINLQTPRGKPISLRVPTAALSPEETVRFLANLEFLDSPNPAATTQQRASIAPDLYWLIRMYAGLTRFIRAGRVSIHVLRRDEQWFAQWQLGTGVAERGWLAEMLAAAPGILVANNPGLAEDMAKTFTHWITAARLRAAGVNEQERSHALHDFVNSLVNDVPLRRGNVSLAHKVGEWNGSITAVNLQLVFIVAAPDDGIDGGTGAGDDTGSDAANTLWPVRVQVRSGTDAPRPVHQLDYDGQTAQKLRSELARAVGVTELVDPYRRDRQASASTSPDEGDWDVYLTLDEIARFVTTDASRLSAAGFAVMLPRAWTTAETTSKLQVARQTNPYDSSTVTRLGFDTLMTYDWKVSVGGVELSDEEMAKLVSSKSGLIKLRGEWVLADTSQLARTKRYIDKLKSGEENGAVTAAELRELALEASVEDPLSAPGAGLEVAGDTWFTSLIGGTDRPAPERVAIPPTVRAELREYQQRGVDWLTFMSRNNLGAVLADDMGLGKTLQLLALLAVEHASGRVTGPTLVVAPTSVVGNWAREAAAFTPELRVLVHHGAHRLKGDELAAAVAEADLVVTSYGIASRDVADLSLVQWDHVVLDEAQAIKNASTRASKSVRALPARHRIALTGTPIENKLAELRSLLDFVNPGMLGSQTFFRNHFAKIIESGRDDPLAAEMGERLQRLTGPFILRRLKTDPAIIDDLPEKAEHVITVDMTAEQAALHTALVNATQAELEKREGMSRKGLVLSTITRIKQICNHPAHYLGDGSPVTIGGQHRSGKVARLMEILDGAVQTGQRVLIFTQYKVFGDIVQPYLSAYLGSDIPFLHGGVGKSARDAMVERFQSPDGPPAMLLSLKAGGTGLNLTAASIVVHMDRWWNPAVENQATDRAFRIGQTRDVTVYKMITRGTMEESIQDVLDGKLQLAGTVVGQGEGWITELDTEDLARLISYRGHND